MRIHRVTVIIGTVGLIGLMAAYIVMNSHQGVFFWGTGWSDHRVVYTRSEHPKVFAIEAVSILLVGLGLVVAAFYAHFGLKLRAAPRTGPWGQSWMGLIMFGISAGIVLVMLILHFLRVL